MKCAQYWPQKEEREAVFEDTNFKLTLVSEDVKSYYTVRQLELENLSVSFFFVCLFLMLLLIYSSCWWVLTIQVSSTSVICKQKKNVGSRIHVYLVCACLQTQETREILHFHYTTWPDFGVPESPASFLNFLFKVRESGCLNSDQGPVVVHCSAGIGRSGTFCLADTCLLLVRKPFRFVMNLIQRQFIAVLQNKFFSFKISQKLYN